VLDWVNVNKRFLTQGRQYIKRGSRIRPDEHPYWVWSTNHNITLPHLSPVYSYSQPIFALFTASLHPYQAGS